MISSVNLFKVNQSANLAHGAKKVSFEGKSMDQQSMPAIKNDTFNKTVKGPTCGVDCCFV